MPTTAERREPQLWLGDNHKQAMTPNGVRQAIYRRGERAGITDLHPHMLRHTFAHTWLNEGGNEGDLMRITGWKSRRHGHPLRRLGG